MRILIRIISFHILVLISPFLTGQVTLENSKIKLVTDGKHIISLYDKERGLEHISSDYTAANGLFGISYADAATLVTTGTVDAGQITTVTIQNSSSDGATFILDNTVLTATVRVGLKAGEAEAVWAISIQLKNASYVVSQVNFPRFRTPKMYDGAYKQFVNPYWDGYMQSMETAWAPYTESYPGKQGMQMSACISKAGGVVTWTDDTIGHIKSFGFLNSGSASNIAVRHLMPLNNSAWEASYETIISLCGNQWQDAAEIYRNWALKQSWSSTPLRNRTDVSAKFHQVPLAISSQVNLEELSTLPSRLKTWADNFGTTVIYRPLGWEKYGNWKSIDYFPASIGDGNFIDLNNRLKSNNINTAGFIEGYHWYFKLGNGTPEQNEAIMQYYNDNGGPSLSRMTINGTLYLAENNSKSFLCRGTSFGQTYQQGVARNLFDRGVTHIHNDFDHLVGADGPCYNKLHGHPVPYGTWETAVMKNVYREIIDEAKNRNITGFSLTKEWPCEIYNMIIHGYQGRNWWAVSTRKNLIPLFVYVYHDYIPVIFGLTTANQSRIELSASIVYGQIQSIAFWNTTVKDPDMSNSSGILMKDYFDAMKGHAKDFLLYGRLLRPSVVSAPGTIHNTWQDNNGIIGLFAIDTLETNTTITVRVPGTSSKYMNIYTGNSHISTTLVTGGQIVSWELPKWRLCSMLFTDNPLSGPVSRISNTDTIVYPNPVTNELQIASKNLITDFNVVVYDLMGNPLNEYQNIRCINMSNFISGMYLLKISAGDLISYHKVLKR